MTDSEDPFIEDIIGPEHPSYAPMQRALLERVTEKESLAKERLREEQENIRRLEKYFDDLGSTLFARQQQLAKHTTILSDVKQQTSSLVTSNAQLSNDVVDLSQKHALCSSSIADQRSAMEKARQELDHLTYSVKYMQSLQAKLQSDVSVNFRTASKTEEAIKVLESMTLDSQINRLNEEIRTQTVQIDILEKDLVAAKAQTEKAIDTVRDGAAALAAIENERKVIKRQIAPSLAALVRRDATVQEMLSTITQTTEETDALAVDESASRSAIAAAQNKDEAETRRKAKAVSESRFLQETLDRQTEEKVELDLQKGSFDRAAESLKEEAAKLVNEIKSEHGKSETIGSAQRLAQADLEIVASAVLTTLAESSTLDREGEAMVKLARELKSKEAVLDSEISLNLNEEARTRLDNLNSQAHNLALSERLAILNSSCTSLEVANNKIRTEISRKHVLLNKKQTKIQRLNAELEKLEKAQASDDTAALAAASLAGKVTHQTAQVRKTSMAVSEAQRVWTRKRTELVKLEHEIEATKDETERLSIRRETRTNQLKRMHKEFFTMREAVEIIERETKATRFELDKTAMLILKYSEQAEKAQVKLRDLKISSADSVEKKQQEFFSRQALTEKTAMDAKELVQAILAAEKDLLLWERNIQLANEMQNLVDSVKDEQEILEMRREIHRMDLRLQGLLKRQGELAKALELSVKKRGVVECKYSKPSNGSSTGGTLRKELEILSRRLSEVQEERNRKEDKREKLGKRFETLTRELGEMHAEFLAVDGLCSDLQKVIEAQRIAGRKFQAIAEFYDPEAVEGSRGQVRQIPAAVLRAVVADANEKFPRYFAAWEELREWLEWLERTAPVAVHSAVVL